jgi:hypothetical protein
LKQSTSNDITLNPHPPTPTPAHPAPPPARAASPEIPGTPYLTPRPSPACGRGETRASAPGEGVPACRGWARPQSKKHPDPLGEDAESTSPAGGRGALHKCGSGASGPGRRRLFHLQRPNRRRQRLRHLPPRRCRTRPAAAFDAAQPHLAQPSAPRQLGLGEPGVNAANRQTRRRFDDNSGSS